jgi:hypothetical protein
MLLSAAEKSGLVMMARIAMVQVRRQAPTDTAGAAPEAGQDHRHFVIGPPALRKAGVRSRD